MKIDRIGAILKSMIKARGYTQEEFAERTGIGLSSFKNTCLEKPPILLKF